MRINNPKRYVDSFISNISVKEELSNQKKAEDEITEMIQPVNTNEVAMLKEQVSKLQEEVITSKQEIAMLKDIVNKLQEEING